MKRKMIFIVLAIMVVLLPIGTIVQAQEEPPGPWTNSTIEFRPDVGVMDPNLLPGVNGYKVFNPGAISILKVKSRGIVPNGAIATAIRRGATDASTYLGSGTGDHDSESDLFEGQIWVDGCIKITGNLTWADCDSHRTSGHIAHADTFVSGAYGTKYTAKSWHHFHTSGYVDWNPTTSDSVTS